MILVEEDKRGIKANAWLLFYGTDIAGSRWSGTILPPKDQGLDFMVLTWSIDVIFFFKSVT